MISSAESVKAGSQPLAGVQIVDFSLLLPGPYCTHLLTEMGATTVKVEPPTGDPVRQMNPESFNFINRGKQSICVDAKLASSREKLLQLMKDADVVVEGFRPGVMDALGLGFEVIKRVNPHVIYASISGYGQDGPYAQRPGHDLNFMAAAGYFASTLDLDDATMQRPRLRFADYTAAMLAAFSIASLLRTPRKERCATHVDANMFDAIAYLTLPSALTATPEIAADPTRRHDVMADVAIYPTADGRAVSLGTLEDKFWLALVLALNSRYPEISNPTWTKRIGRTRDKRQLAQCLRAIFAQMTLVEVEALLPADSVCWAPVLRGTELLADPHLMARGLVQNTDTGVTPSFPVSFNGDRPMTGISAPSLGQQNQVWGFTMATNQG
jgi:crotonobetainyl-CoA:carnitine CoA-transferase CaiB-like acyl-CoA transferase